MSSSRNPLLVAAAVVTLTVAIVPFMQVQLDPATSFVPSLITAVTVFDVMSVYLLVGDFRDRGELRYLVTAMAYVWSLTVMISYALAFPLAFTADPPFAFNVSTAPYLYLTWHCGFPVLLGLAWAPWPARLSRPVPTPLRFRYAVGVTAGAVVLGSCVVALLGAFADHLPVLIDGLDTTRMTTLTGPIVLPLVVVALVVAVRGAWDRTGPERWVPVAVLACLCDLLLTYASRSRFSLGWYGGRSLTIVATGVVLGAMLVSFRRLKAQAERDAFSDSLTHLTNRRGALAALDFMITPVGRGRSTIGVVALDLDFFKSVNDNDGHAAGDAVLVEVGRVLGSTSRGGDVAARVGGEEFLVILHDTDASGALIAAERLRVQIADMVVPGVGTKVTASIGVTVLEPQDLDPGEVLRRADEALYEAKHNGRNRVESKFLEKLALSKGQP